MLLLERNLLICVLLLLWPLFSWKLSPAAHYLMAVTVLIAMLIPVRPSMPIEPLSITVPSVTNVARPLPARDETPVA